MNRIQKAMPDLIWIFESMRVMRKPSEPVLMHVHHSPEITSSVRAQLHMATQWPQHPSDIFFLLEDSYYSAVRIQAYLTNATCVPKTPLRILFRIQWKHLFWWALNKIPMSTLLAKQGMWTKVTCLHFLFCDKLLSGLPYFHYLGDRIVWD